MSGLEFVWHAIEMIIVEYGSDIENLAKQTEKLKQANKTLRNKIMRLERRLEKLND